MLGCTKNGTLIDAEFSKPLPWVGLYIVVGTIACILCIVVDTFLNFRHRKLWFPTKFFSLNAATLTFLGIATKFAVDLNTPMPSRHDQLAKLSSTTLICTAIANFMPSLGTMRDSDIFSNVIALVIFVITVIVNMCMQMGTGVIYVFLPEHALVMFFMLVQLLIMCSSALLVAPVRHLLEDMYDFERRKLKSPYEVVNTQVSEGAGSLIETLKEYVKKCWLIAHTSSPQYVFGRLPPCTASGALCLLSALVLLEASLRSFSTDSLGFCRGTSDYKWSSTLVFFMQAISVGVGTIAPALRCCNAVRLENPSWSFKVVKVLFLSSVYTFYNSASKWANAPSPVQISNRRIRKIFNKVKLCIMTPFVFLLGGIVVVSKLGSTTLRMALSCLEYGCRRLILKRPTDRNSGTSNEQISKHADSYSDHVLHMMGEEDIVGLILSSALKYRDRWMKREKKQPTTLITLIREHSTENFQGVLSFDSNMVPSIWGSVEPPNCWALPVVTLTTIAVALSYLDQSLIGQVDSLLRAVSEGLRYARLVDKHLDGKWFVKMSKAAEFVWLEIDGFDKCCGKDLNSLVKVDTNSLVTMDLMSVLGRIGGNSVRQFPSWRQESLGGNCLYRVSRTIMLKLNNSSTTKDLFELLQMTISDILGACLTNLPHAVYMECIHTDANKGWREVTVREASLLLLEGEDILNILGKRQLAGLCEGEQQYIDNWRKKKQEGP